VALADGCALIEFLAKLAFADLIGDADNRGEAGFHIFGGGGPR
jgi:hypothetical protein